MNNLPIEDQPDPGQTATLTITFPADASDPQILSGQGFEASLTSDFPIEWLPRTLLRVAESMLEGQMREEIKASMAEAKLTAPLPDEYVDDIALMNARLALIKLAINNPTERAETFSAVVDL